MIRFGLIFLTLFFAGISFSLNAQDCSLDSKPVQAALKKHIEYLASDELGGRMTGTPGEKLAREYLATQFAEMGLNSPLSDGFFQPFQVRTAVGVDPYTQLKAGGKTFEIGKDFFPLQYSSNAEVADRGLVNAGYGITAEELGHDDYDVDVEWAGNVFLLNYSSPDGVHPHSKFTKYQDLKDRLTLAKSMGAAAVIVYNPDNDLRDPAASFRKIQSLDIPIIFVKNEHNAFFETLPKIEELKVKMSEQERTGNNVVAFDDNGVERTIVIGAHYDHLGLGEEGSLAPDSHEIHNGADDNASGTAALVELARYLTPLEGQNNNYLFLAFSGEEMGLLGSKYFADHSPIPVEKMNYMLNMDMVGRLELDKGIGVNGTGTSPKWEKVLKDADAGLWPIKSRKSGVGPSDHTSFYLKEMPVLHFFSGTHSDYHKPSDDANKINYEGIGQIMCLMAGIIERLDDEGELAFSTTKEESSGAAPRFTVTLGVMPDYLFEGEGMRIDGIREGKPAEKAKMKKGDVVIQMGDVKVRDMMSYMRGLSLFKKGDKTTVIVKRGKKTKKLKVQF